ncbi:MAG: hypothetical protein CMF58_02930 [Lentimicrobiaceae bacterium]|nr:hypothetical protein [Lentimicrobiaceae bacterium]
MKRLNDKGLNTILWVFAICITIGLVIYQRSTDPSYPLAGEVLIEGETINFKLIRTFGGNRDALVRLNVPNNDINGTITLKQYKSYDDWSSMEMFRDGNELVGVIPNQPMTGKVEYIITLNKNDIDYELTVDPVIISFKGEVPRSILIPHIFFMFMALLFSLRVGLEVFFRKKDTKYFTGVVLFTLFLGGLLLGPLVQKYAFDAYWTGWPFGHDTTNNKTLIVFIFWVIAWFVLRKKPKNILWPFIAVIVMLIVYAIPHSMPGSEIDHTKQQTEEIK